MARKSETNSYQDRDITEVKGDIKEIRKHMAVLNGEYGSIKTDVKWLKLQFGEMKTVMDDISKKVNMRPSWITATVFSVLFSALIGLVVYLITN